MSTGYSFSINVTRDLLDTMINTGTKITATKPVAGGGTSTVWISLTDRDIAVGSTLKVSWKEEYYMLFNDTPLEVGSTVVTVSNEIRTSLGPATPSAWRYGPNPDGFVAIDHIAAPRGSASVLYQNPGDKAQTEHHVTVGFGLATTKGATTTILPIGAKGSQHNFKTTFTPHEVVFIGLYDYEPGQAIDISTESAILQFTATPNGLDVLEWDIQNNQFNIKH